MGNPNEKSEVSVPEQAVERSGKLKENLDLGALSAEKMHSWLEQNKNSIQENENHAINLNQIFESTAKFLGGVFTKAQNIKEIISSLSEGDNISKFVNEYSKSFTALNISVLGASKSFTGLNNAANVKNIGYFSDQIVGITKQTNNVNELGSSFKKMFGFNLPLDALNAAGKSIKSYMIEMAAAADNQLKLQQATIGSAAASGDIGQIWSRAGNNLQNLNAITEERNAMITASSKATNTDQAIMIEHYQALGQVSGALTTNIELGEKGTNTMSVLTAATKLAAGTGQDFALIAGDMKTALQQYNKTGEEALRFTANISSLNEKLGVELNDVRSYMNKVAESFGAMGDQTDSAAKSYYVLSKSLQDVGVSAHRANEMVINITNGISGMSIAQKGFISAQSGGAGGLMGGFQMDLLIKQNKMNEVMQKSMDVMKKQFGGKPVTVEEAASSPQAAAQLQKQIMMVRQGPLASLAKDDTSAMKLIEAMGKGEMDFKKEIEGLSGKGGAKDPLKEGIDRGTKLQERQTTLLSISKQHLEGIRSNTAGLALRSIQSSFSAARDGGSHSVMALARMTTAQAQVDGANVVNKSKTQIAKDTSKEDLGESMQNTAKFGIQASKVLINGFSSLLDEKLSNSIISDEAEADAKAERERKENKLKANQAAMSTATRQNIQNNRAQNLQHKDMQTNNHMANASSPTHGSIDVNITGYCLECKSRIDNSHHTSKITGTNAGGIPASFKGKH